jgi:hypothetical protein
MLDGKESKGDLKEKQYNFKSLLEETLDKIAKEELVKATRTKVKQGKKKDTSSTEITLTLVRDIFSEIAARQTDADQPDPLFNELVDWCVTNWYAISGSIGKSRACLEISEEFRKFRANVNDASTSLPLHNCVPGKGSNAIATLILFKKNKVKLTPGSKVMLFSDPEKTDLLMDNCSSRAWTLSSSQKAKSGLSSRKVPTVWFRSTVVTTREAQSNAQCSTFQRSGL